MLSTTGRVSRRNYCDVQGPPERITPLYDNLLVRRLHEDEYSGLLALPGMTKTDGGKWVRRFDEGPRRGVVIAKGRGDKCPWRCTWCGSAFPELLDPLPDLITCVVCGTHGGTQRVYMDVQVGDVVIYPRFESTHMQIDGQMFTFVHEADVMAVIEGEPISAKFEHHEG